MYRMTSVINIINFNIKEDKNDGSCPYPLHTFQLSGESGLLLHILGSLASLLLPVTYDRAKLLNSPASWLPDVECGSFIFLSLFIRFLVSLKSLLIHSTNFDFYGVEFSRFLGYVHSFSDMGLSLYIYIYIKGCTTSFVLQISSVLSQSYPCWRRFMLADNKLDAFVISFNRVI